MLPHIPDSITLVGPLLLLAAAPLLAKLAQRRHKAEPEPDAWQHRSADVWAGFQEARERHPWGET